jgi:hypothetical protein
MLITMAFVMAAPGRQHTRARPRRARLNAGLVACTVWSGWPKLEVQVRNARADSAVAARLPGQATPLVGEARQRAGEHRGQRAAVGQDAIRPQGEHGVALELLHLERRGQAVHHGLQGPARETEARLATR